MKEWGVGAFLPQGTVSLKKETAPLHKLSCPASQEVSPFHSFPTTFSIFFRCALRGRGGGQEVGDGANQKSGKVSRHSGVCL